MNIPDIRLNDGSRALSFGSVLVYEQGTTVLIGRYDLDEFGFADIHTEGVYDVSFYNRFGDLLQKECNVNGAK